MRVISQFKKIHFYQPRSIEQKNYESLLDDYCYIIYRLLEEAKVFKIIFYGEDEENDKEEEGTNQYYLYYQDKTVVLIDMLTELSH